VEPIVGRREVVFVGGQRLYQVLSSGALAPGTFYVEESAGRIHIAVSGGAPQAVDVAVRPMTLDINGARNLTVKGFEFSGAASPFERSSVRIVNATGASFVDNIVTGNSWVGVSLVTSQDLTASGNLVESNGGGGMTVYQVGQLKLLGNETSRNNWRGVRGDYVGWSIGAVKMLGSHGALIDGHVSRDNHTRGFWADYDITDLTIRNSVFCGNLTDGLFIEGAQGPVNVTNTIACDNGRYGVLISNGRHVQLSGNTMCRNATSGLRLDSDGNGGRTITTSTGSILLAGADHLTMTNNTFGASPRLIDSNLPSGQWGEFVNTLSSNGNRFVTGAQVAAFRFQGSTGTLANWQTATGEDGSSTISASGC
jgi:parallel beta-helix repeat protein